ncbi:hypothetical protein ACLOJK_004814 [Asimina triloba]
MDARSPTQPWCEITARWATSITGRSPNHPHLVRQQIGVDHQRSNVHRHRSIRTHQVQRAELRPVRHQPAARFGRHQRAASYASSVSDESMGTKKIRTPNEPR